MDPTALAVQIADRHRSDPSSRPRPAAWTVRRDPSVTALDVLFGVACNLALRYGLPIVAFEVLSSAARLCARSRTGFKAAMSHAPVVDGKERYVFWVAPHIAMSGTNEVGKVWRPGRDKSSTACGALLAVLGGINQRRLDMMLDPSDIEMSLIKQSVMSFLDYGNQPNLQELTYAVHECIVASVERTAEAAVDLAKSEYIIISGIQVHAGFSENFFWPGTMKKYTAEGVTDLYEEYASRMAEWRTTDEARSFFEDQELLMLQNTEGICRRAAQSGDLAALQQKASEINLEKVQDHSRRTLLHVAAAFGQVEVGNYLLSQCSTASFLHARDNLHLTAIDLAVLKQNYDFAQLLMDRGAGLEGEFLANGLIAAVEGGEIKHLEKLMWFAKDTSTAVHMSNKDGQSLVYIAAQLKDEATRMAMMEVLLSFGADIKQTDFYGNTPAVSEEMVTALKRAPSGENKGAEEKGDE